MKENIDKVDKVDIQAKNAGYHEKLDKVHFCSGYQGYQGYQNIIDFVSPFFERPSARCRRSKFPALGVLFTIVHAMAGGAWCPALRGR